MSSLILVTGATGFIGRHLVAGLGQQGHRVRVALRAPVRGNEPALGDESVIIGEVGPQTDWTEALRGTAAVVHLAGMAHRLNSRGASPEDYHRINALGTARLADAVALSSAGRLVFISSIAVTGSFSEEPVSEQTPPAPDSPYGHSKLEAEQAIERILTGTLPDWCILRPALVYGPGNPGNMARLLKLVRFGLPLPLAAIPNRRSFLYVENLVDLIGRVLVAPEASRRTFAVADSETVSTSELLRLIGDASGRPVRLFAAPGGLLRFAADVGGWTSARLGGSIGLDRHALDRLFGSLTVDISGLRSRLGWQPPHSLETGLRRTLPGA